MTMRIPAVILASILGISSLRAAENASSRLSFQTMPKDCDVKGVPGREKAEFTAGYEDGTNKVLRMTSDKATAALQSRKLGVDLTKTPIMRWRWKIVLLPAGADGRSEKLDDQLPSCS